MAAIPFGFSFGDFVAGIEIIHKAAQALRRSSGAHRQFHQAIADLESIADVLRRVEALSPHSHPDTMEAVRACAFKCSIPLNHFMHRIHKYEKHMQWASNSRAPSVKNVVGGYWKIKWALRVEDDVSKLKTDIGPLLDAMNTLLHIETLDRQELTLQEMQRLGSSANHALSQLETSLISFQRQVATSTQVERLEMNINNTMHSLVQQVRLLATNGQVRKMDSGVENISQQPRDVPESAQVSQIEAVLQASAIRQANDGAHPSVIAQRHQQHLDRVRRAVMEVDELVLRSPALHDLIRISQAPAIAREDSRPAWNATAAGTNIGSFDSRQDSAMSDEPRTVASWPFVVNLIRELFVAVVAMLVQSVPAIQAYLLTFATLVMAPQLLAGNSIMLTDALNRTKLLPYEYFSDWDMCQTWLKHTFHGMPGGTRVERGDFAMFKRYVHGVGPVINPKDWSQRVRPGDRVVMSVLVEFQSKFRIACRGCGAGSSGRTHAAGWIKWYVRLFMRRFYIRLTQIVHNVDNRTSMSTKPPPKVDRLLSCAMLKTT